MQVEFKDVSLRFGEKSILQGFNLKVVEGEKLLIKGPSGSGKSTLLRLILGFVQPDAGEVRIDGEPLKRENVWSLRRRMAFVPQELRIGSGKVRDFIQDIYGYRANQHLKYDEEEIRARFEQFDLEPDKLQQDIRELSGGEKQRVGLILALLLDRELYLLDEVTSAMDADLRQKVIDHLARLEGKTMIIVSHDRGWEGYDFREVSF
jgi:putative ABC transport system ATP-binding protein